MFLGTSAIQAVGIGNAVEANGFVSGLSELPRLLPAVVEKSEAAADGLVHDLNGGLLVYSVARVMSAQARHANLITVLAEVS